jgi:hypothetical protein
MKADTHEESDNDIWRVFSDECLGLLPPVRGEFSLSFTHSQRIYNSKRGPSSFPPPPSLRLQENSFEDPGSGIRCLFDHWIWDLGWVHFQDPDPG